MLGFQSYLFSAAFRALLLVLGALAAVALLTQGLAQMDVIIEDRQSALTYLWVTLLASPLVISMTLPLAVFIACVTTLNGLHRDNEIVVAQAAGLTRWQTAAPLLRLATLAALLQLAFNIWVQPTAYREMREVVVGAKADIAAVLIQEGEFTSPSDGLTFFSREVKPGGELRGLLIHDARNAADTSTFVARSGIITTVDGAPAILMREGQGHQVLTGTGLNILDFDEYLFDLTPFMREPDSLRLKSSDRYLPELFSPDLTSFWDNQNQDDFLAEGHARLASPLLCLAMAMLAVVAVVGGPLNRTGYGRRIAVAAVFAVILRLLSLAVQSEAGGDPALNAVQYLLPLSVFLGLVAFFLIGHRRTMPRKVRPSGPLAAIPANGGAR
jgi:lipopolysaccharide export system permease protein